MGVDVTAPAQHPSAAPDLIGRVAERVDRFPYLSAVLLTGFTLAFFTVGCWMAGRKAFWTDELYLFHISSRPSLGELWDGLLERPDALPPLTYYLTYFLGHAFGFNHVT